MSFRSTILFTCFILLACFRIEAQVAIDTTWKRSDFIANTDEYLSYKLNGFSELQRFQFEGDNLLDIRPNTAVRNRLSVNYKWLTVGFSFKIPTLFGNDDTTKGETTTRSFSTAINLDKWSFSFDYNQNKGHYLANSVIGAPIPVNQDYILFPNFITTSTRLDIGYLTNPNFSLKALTSLTERQLKSSGSFIPFVRLVYFTTQNEPNDLIVYDKTRNYQGLLGVAYNHKFVVYESYYLGGVASVGYGLIRSELIGAPSGRRLKTSTLFGYGYGLNLGYNGKRFFAGAVFNYNDYDYEENREVDLASQTTGFEVFIGYRFRVPKFLRKPLAFVDETKQKIIK